MEMISSWPSSMLSDLNAAPRNMSHLQIPLPLWPNVVCSWVRRKQHQCRWDGCCQEEGRRAKPKVAGHVYRSWLDRAQKLLLLGFLLCVEVGTLCAVCEAPCSSGKEVDGGCLRQDVLFS